MSCTVNFIQNRLHKLGFDLSVPAYPQGIKQPKLVKKNIEVATLLGLSAGLFEQKSTLDIFSGNYVPNHLTPVAQAYAGHQFGNFNPFLGDGRSILLGELEHANNRWELYLKGAGKTPWTFAADGRASLQECLHEYETSERLVKLGVNTSRSLCIIQGEEKVYRSGFKPTAIITRAAPCHIRFGTFELCYFRKDIHALRALADYVIEHFYPDCAGDTNNDENNYSRFFCQVVVNTAKLIASWQSVGFVHGMMNTDNQSILGITLDPGESAFTDDYDDDFVASANDKNGRYAFAKQPLIGLWNCNVLARALSPLISAEKLKKSLSVYESVYLNHFKR